MEKKTINWIVEILRLLAAILAGWGGAQAGL